MGLGVCRGYKERIKMNKIYNYLIIIIFTLLGANAAFPKPPNNLTCLKREIINYYDSGEYEKDVDSVVQEAEDYLQKRIKENNAQTKPEKLAIVLDIDETSLSNFLANKQRDFSGLPTLIEKSYRQANSPAVKPVLRLYKAAVSQGVSAFFISFRPASSRLYTIENLKKSGYIGWSKIFFPNHNEIKLPAQIYKTAMREKLTKSGYTIILNLGDQDSDLNGGYAERIVKIPNPLYTTSKTCEEEKC